MASSASMAKPAGGVRKPAAKRAEVIEALFAHAAADGMLLKFRTWRLWRALPGLAGVSLPTSGRIGAIDTPIPAAIDVVWRECPWACRCSRNMRVKVAIVAAEPRNAAVIECTARVGVKVGAPIMRPLPAVPRVEPIIMFGMHDAWPPVVINVNVIEADMAVIKVVVPAPAIWTPPRVAPCPQPTSGGKPETEPNPPVVREPHPKSIRARPAYPVIADVRRIVITGAIDHDVIRAHLGAQITGCITHIDLVRGRAIDLRVGYIMER